MWPFSRSKSHLAPVPTRSRGFRPSLETLGERTLPSSIVPINQQVLAYAESHVGQIVGDGQCATLAQDAVQSAHGVPFYQLGPTGQTASYVWGRPVTTLTPSNGNTAAVQPGDILQFNNVTEVDTMTVHYANGRSTTSVSTQAPFHHTAIVSAVGGNARNDLQVLQSNVSAYQGEPLRVQLQDQGGIYWGGSSTVTTNYPQYGFSITVTHTMTSGSIQVYQPYRLA
jgi:hypothetical protein